LARLRWILHRGPQDVGDAGLREQSGAVERRIRGRLPELPRERVRLEDTFRDPDARDLQDVAVLERDLHVARDSVRRGIETLGERERDAVLLVQECRRALALERELRALELEKDR